MGERSNLRASDADREHIAERLRNALTEGRLTQEEFEERLRAGFSAKTYGELDPLVADLPPAGGGPDYAFAAQQPAAVANWVPVPARSTTNGLAIASLVTGIAGFIFLWGIGPLLALVLGTRAKKEIKRSNGTQRGSGLATAGIILGIVGLFITAVLIFGIVASRPESQVVIRGPG